MRPEQEKAGVIGKADLLVEQLARHGELGPAELATLTAIPRSTVYRLLEGLTDIGLVAPMPDGRSALALKWLHLADAARGGMFEWSGAHAILEDLNKSTGQTVFLTVPRQTDTVCIDWVQGRGMDALMLRPGQVLPFHAGAAGRAALAALPDAVANTYLRSFSRKVFNARTLTDPDAIRADIARTRERAYALSEEDVTFGIGAIGIAIQTPGHKRLIGCLSLAGPVQEIRVYQTDLAAALFDARRRLLSGRGAGAGT